MAYVEQTGSFEADAGSDQEVSTVGARSSGQVSPRAARLFDLLGRLVRTRTRRLMLMAALVLTAPSIAGGFSLDDYVLLYQMQYAKAEWPGRAPFDLFRWMEPTQVRALMDGAGMPWWTFEQARCAFFRPLSSLTHALDNALWPHSAALMHLHNLLWFVLLLFVVGRTYRALLDNPWVRAVALAMFAFDSAHGTALGWISNRNALLCGVFGVSALLFHHRRQSGAGRGFALGAWLCFGLALLSGELAIGIAGYLFAYAFAYERGSLVRRARSLAPYALIAMAWAILRKLGGYGSYGLGAYVDPIQEPIEFLRQLPQRWIVLMGSQLVRIGADGYDLLPARFVPLLMGAALIATALCIAFVWPVLQRSSARFLALGAALSALPLAATISADRLLVLVGFGVMPVLAQAIHDALRNNAGFRSRSDAHSLSLQRSFAVFLIGLHLFVEPLALPVAALTPAFIDHWTRTADESLPVDPSVRDQVVIVASVPDSVLLTYLPTMRSLNGKPRPDKLYWLDATPGEAHFERRASNVLRVSSNAGVFDRRSEARGKQVALRVGDKIVLSEMTIEVHELNAQGLPSVCDFVFAHTLESPQYRWETWQGGRLRPFEVPHLGETKTVVTS